MEEAKKAIRTFKDSIFRSLFNDEDILLELYNALSGSNYPPGTKIEIVTLENAIFADVKDDLAFIIDNRLIVLVEHQSTVNPNMPLRELIYIAKKYENLVYSTSIYSKHQVKIPVPEFYVFYNGIEEQPLEQEMKLSDAFIEKCDKIVLEVVVKVINVNYEKGAEILARCQTLQEYSQFIYRVRTKYRETGDLQMAIEESIRECIEEGILTEFLKKNGGEIMSFLYDALTREECEAIREEDGYRRGVDEGMREGLTKGQKLGVAEGKQSIARNMLEKGMDLKTIEEITGLSEKDVRELQQ